MSSIIIKNGEYRNKPVINTSFTMVKGLQTNKKGNYITVKNEGHFPVNIDTVKIKINDISDIEFKDGVVSFVSHVEAAKETDEEAMNRIATRFEILGEMSKACIEGDIKALIVTGPPGVGKSHTVEQQIEKFSIFEKISQSKMRYNVIKGAMSALGLYVQLYKYSDKGNVLVFDDMDALFTDELSLNILKAALDSGKRRKICWNTDSRLLAEEGIPNSFEFQGSAIFITNIKFSHIRSKKLQDHLDALQSRCHHLDLTIDSQRDKILRIRQVHRDTGGGLFLDYRFDSDQPEMILSYMEEHANKLREVSLRMALKLADLVKISPNNWKNLAESTCHRLK